MGTCRCCNKQKKCDYIRFQPVQVIEPFWFLPDFSTYFPNTINPISFPIKYQYTDFKYINDIDICPSGAVTASDTGVYYELCQCDNSVEIYPSSLEIKNIINEEESKTLIFDNFKNISNSYQLYNFPYKSNCETLYNYSRMLIPELNNYLYIDKNGKQFVKYDSYGNPSSGINKSGIYTTGIVNITDNITGIHNSYYFHPAYSYIAFNSASGDSIKRFLGSGDVISASINMCENGSLVLAQAYKPASGSCHPELDIALFTYKIEFEDPIKANLWELTSISGIRTDPLLKNNLIATYPIFYKSVPPESPPDVTIEEKPVKIIISSELTCSTDSFIGPSLIDPLTGLPYCAIQKISNKAKGIAEKLKNFNFSTEISTSVSWNSKYYKAIDVDFFDLIASFIYDIEAPDLEDFNNIFYYRNYFPVNQFFKGITPLSYSKKLDFRLTIPAVADTTVGRSFLTFTDGDNLEGNPVYFNECGELISGVSPNFYQTFCPSSSLKKDPIISNQQQYFTNGANFISFGSNISRDGFFISPSIPIGDENLYAYYTVSVIFGGRSFLNVSGCSPNFEFPNFPCENYTNTFSYLNWAVGVDLYINASGATAYNYWNPYVFGKSGGCFYKNGDCISTTNCNGNTVNPPFNISPYDSAIAYGRFKIETII